MRTFARIHVGFFTLNPTQISKKAKSQKKRRKTSQEFLSRIGLVYPHSDLLMILAF